MTSLHNLTDNHILVGLGGTGGKILKAFKKRLFSEFTPDERAKLPIGFVYVDSSLEMMNPNDKSFRVLGQNASFTNSEFVNIKSVDLEAIFSNLSSFPGLKGFVGNPEVMLRTIGTIGNEGAAGQKRRLGRILFAASVQEYLSVFNNQYTKTKSICEKEKLFVHIFTGLAGGTGSGSIIDVIAQTRLNYPDANIVVFAMVPEANPPQGCDSGRYHENGYAALKELNALQILDYIPYDVSGKFDRVPLKKSETGVADGTILFTNINESGVVMNSFETLPALVSDFVFYRIFLEYNDQTTVSFLRSYSFENIDDWLFEYNESPEETLNRARSKRFSSFGIKRVIYPEKRILEHATYTVGQKVLYSFRYNNWIDNVGFSDTPANIDYNTYVAEKSNLENWKIADANLILANPILESDKKGWITYKDYWDNVIPVLTEEAKSRERPLHDLAAFCEDRLQKNFRKVGVKTFFENKTSVLKEQSAELVNKIESFLFDKWNTGSLSIHDLTKLTDKILEYVEKKKTEFETLVSSYDEEIDKLGNLKAQNEITWANLSLVERALGKGNRIFGEQQTLLSRYYLRKTEIHGISFGILLLTKLRMDLEQLRSSISSFANTISETIKITESQITARKLSSGNVIKMDDSIVEVSEEDKINYFEKEIINDKTRQGVVASEIRRNIVSKVDGTPNFAKINDVIDKDNIVDIFDTILREQVISLHSEICTKDSDKILGVNILQQLEKVLNTDDLIRTFATNIVEKSAVFMQLNPSEVRKSPRGLVSEPGTNICRRTVLVTIPKIEGNDRILTFANKLKAAIQNAVKGGIEVKVDPEGSRTNEITIACINYCFPIRAIQAAEPLKRDYELMINNPQTAKESRIILHTEGEGDFPDLFLPVDIPVRDYLPYVILFAAMEQIKHSDLMDGTGKKAWCIIEKDDFGDDIPTKLSDSFTSIVDSDLFNPKMGEKMKRESLNSLKNEYLHVNKRTDLVEAVKAIVKDIVLVECNNNLGSSTYNDFKNKALEAITIINKA